MYFIRTNWIVYGIPVIEIAKNELIGKNDKSSILLQYIWIIKPIIIFMGVYSVKVILPSLKFCSKRASKSLVIT